MQTASYNEVARQLDDTLEFCAGLDLTADVAASRFKTYGDHIDRLMEAIRKPRPSPVAEQDTLEDRSLELVMFRRRKDETVERLGRVTDAEAQRLRDACALACLTCIEDIVTAYDLAPQLLDRQDVDDRAVDLWAPLLALALVADAEAGGDRAERLLWAARELSDARDAADEGGSAARLVAALQHVASESGTLLTPTELLPLPHERGYPWVKSPRGLAGLLAPLGLVARPRRDGGRRGRFYLLDPDTLADPSRRYNPVTREGDTPADGLAAQPQLFPAESVDSRDKR